jgi:hypothetical protein
MPYIRVVFNNKMCRERKCMRLLKRRGNSPKPQDYQEIQTILAIIDELFYLNW